MGKESSWEAGKILLPLSYTSYEINAVYIAFYIAECSGSPITIFHVKPQDEIENVDLLKELERFATKFKIKYDLKEKTLDTPFSHKAVASIIIDEARKKEYDYVVMSAHREAFYIEFFGRISDRVVRELTKKIVLVESPKEGLKMPIELRKILVATFSENISVDAVSLATLLTSSASTRDAEISVVSIVELPPTVPLDFVVSSPDFKQKERTFTHSISTYIKLLGRPLTPVLLPIRETDDVIKYFKEKNIDLVLLSTTRPKFMRSLLSKKEYSIIKSSSIITLVIIPSQ